MSAAVDRLNLSPAAAKAAEALLAIHPEVVFTSGRRTVNDQARAMGQNVAKSRSWISQTYVPTPQSAELQRWVNDNPEIRAAAEIERHLAAIMSTWTDKERGHLSAHFSGNAFDVQPVPGPEGDAIKATIRQLPGLVKFLDHEGSLVRWHVQIA